MMTKQTLIKIRYSSWETGWALDLGNGLAEINNNPLAPDIGFGDIVRITDPDESNYFPEILEVIERKFKWKAFIQYPEKAHITMIFEEAKKMGLSLENGMEPKDGKMGICALSCNKKNDAKKILTKLGILDKVEWEVAKVSKELDKSRFED